MHGNGVGRRILGRLCVTAFFALAFLFIVTGCHLFGGPRRTGGSGERGANAAGPASKAAGFQWNEASRAFEITWTCAGNRNKANIPGWVTKELGLPAHVLRQDEYCEWSIDELKPGEDDLTCAFRTTFDTGRRHFLNMRRHDAFLATLSKAEADATFELGVSLKTKSNTYAALGGATEPPTAGIVGDCLAKGALCRDCALYAGDKAKFNACKDAKPPFVTCHADRQSDPHLCDRVQDMVHGRACKDFSLSYTLPLVSASNKDDRPTEVPRPGEVWKRAGEGDTRVKLLLRVSPLVAAHCGHTVDREMKGKLDTPDGTHVTCTAKRSDGYRSCDEFAEHLHVVVKGEAGQCR